MASLARRLRLIVIADRDRVPDLELKDRVERALVAGATAIQLRDKVSAANRTLPFALELAEVARRHAALFFMNDRLDLALAAGADGVHLGPEDLPVAAARKVAGAGFLIGASTGTPEEAVTALAEGADYMGCGAVFATRSKDDAGDPIGVEGLARVVAAVPVPVVGIGGITVERAALVQPTGAAGVAVISQITEAESVESTVRGLLAPWSNAAD